MASPLVRLLPRPRCGYVRCSPPGGPLVVLGAPNAPLPLLLSGPAAVAPRREGQGFPPRGAAARGSVHGPTLIVGTSPPSRGLTPLPTPRARACASPPTFARVQVRNRHHFARPGVVASHLARAHVRITSPLAGVLVVSPTGAACLAAITRLHLPSTSASGTGAAYRIPTF